MESFKIKESFGGHCNECGKVFPGQVSNQMEINGVVYTLCNDCFKRFIGELYLAKTPVFEEFIGVLARKDREGILKIINNIK